MSNQLEEVSKVEEKSMQQESIKPVALKYGCEVLQEKTTHQVANDKSLPNDAYLITYIVNGETHIDLTRCKSQVSLFDMYYDTYGAGAVQSIGYGYGTSNPKLWGNSKKTETKKRK